MAGAPAGNQNAAKRNRMLSDALKRELTQDPEKVLKIANKLIDSAIAGEAWAQQLIHERVDGKVPQAIVGDDEEAPLQFTRVVRQIVRTDASDKDG
jgi:hypothetical protein